MWATSLVFLFCNSQDSHTQRTSIHNKVGPANRKTRHRHCHHQHFNKLRFLSYFPQLFHPFFSNFFPTFFKHAFSFWEFFLYIRSQYYVMHYVRNFIQREEDEKSLLSVVARFSIPPLPSPTSCCVHIIYEASHQNNSSQLHMILPL